MAALLVKLLVIAAVVLAVIAFLSAVVSGFSAPHWVLPTAVLALGAALGLTLL